MITICKNILNSFKLITKLQFNLIHSINDFKQIRNMGIVWNYFNKIMHV